MVTHIWMSGSKYFADGCILHTYLKLCLSSREVLPLQVALLLPEQIFEHQTTEHRKSVSVTKQIVTLIALIRKRNLCVVFLKIIIIDPNSG